MAQKPIAVVTGASGYLATNIIKKLIDRGYPTRSTVRNLDDPKVAQLKALFPSLELYQAELTKPGSFDEVIRGATYVFHAASPVAFGAPDPQKDLVEPAVAGTKTVLESAAKAGTVKRVVFTSSIAAVVDTNKVKENPEYVFSEKDWNAGSSLSFEPYRYSKYLAEQAAWDFVKEHKDFDLISINPSFIIGPPLKRDDGISVQIVKSLFEGKVSPGCYGMVDVRDVAEAHVRAIENQNASGRYLLASPTAVPFVELSKVFASTGKYPQYNFTTTVEGPPPNITKFDRSKAEKDLGITFTPLEKSLVDMAEAFFELGILTRKN